MYFVANDFCYFELFSNIIYLHKVSLILQGNKIEAFYRKI